MHLQLPHKIAQNIQERHPEKSHKRTPTCHKANKNLHPDKEKKERATATVELKPSIQLLRKHLKRTASFTQKMGERNRKPPCRARFPKKIPTKCSHKSLSRLPSARQTDPDQKTTTAEHKGKRSALFYSSTS